jgi:hypothetical protein
MADEIRDVLRQWIGIDDEIRTLLAQVKTLRERKTQLGQQVTQFMREQNLDQFVSRVEVARLPVSSAPFALVRTSRSSGRRLRCSLPMTRSAWPKCCARSRVSLPPGQEPDAESVTTRELLTRRLPRTQQISLQ